MNDKRHHFELANKQNYPGYKKERCPRCQKAGTYRRFVNKHTGELLPIQYGLCDRADNCPDNLTPWKDGYKPEGSNTVIDPDHLKQIQQKRTAEQKRRAAYPSRIDRSLLERSIKQCSKNTLVQFAYSYFGDMAYTVAEEMGVGSNKDGKTVFWQQDQRGEVRTGKIIKYKPNGKRSDQYTNWVQHLLFEKDQAGVLKYTLQQTPFGTHLLSVYPDEVVNLVESEKTAYLARMYYGKSRGLWLATGGMHNIGPDMMKPLEGRIVIAWPDLGKASIYWQENLPKNLNSKSLSFNWMVHENQQKYNLQNGDDLADLLLIRLEKLKPLADKVNDAVNEKPPPILNTDQRKLFLMTRKNRAIENLVQTFGLTFNDGSQVDQNLMSA